MADKRSGEKQKGEIIEKNCIFSKENVNMGHQPEFDYLKTLGVFCITTAHVYLHYNINGYLYSLVYYLCTILTAGALMILMGIGMKYSRHHEPKNYFERAFVLLTMGQYLNILRDSLL